MISHGEGCDISNSVEWNGVGDLKVGDCTFIAKEVVIYTHHHDEAAGWEPDKADHEIPTSLFIGNHVFIGRRAIILSSCHSIGDYAVIGAGAVVTKDVPAYETWAGNPARCIKVRR